MALNLTKGQTINLSKDFGALTKVTLGLGWRGRRGSVDLDSYIGTKDAKGNAIQFDYFGNCKRHRNGIYHHGDDLVGGGGAKDPNEVIDIELNSLSANAHSLVCGLFTFSSGASFADVKDAFINLTDQSGKELARFNISEFRGASSLVAAEIRKVGGEWKFKASGVPGNHSARQVQNFFSTGNKVPTTGFTVPDPNANNQSASNEGRAPQAEQPRRSWLGRLMGN